MSPASRSLLLTLVLSATSCVVLGLKCWECTYSSNMGTVVSDACQDPFNATGEGLFQTPRCKFCKKNYTSQGGVEIWTRTCEQLQCTESQVDVKCCNDEDLCNSAQVVTVTSLFLPVTTFITTLTTL